MSPYRKRYLIIAAVLGFIALQVTGCAGLEDVAPSFRPWLFCSSLIPSAILIDHRIRVSTNKPHFRFMAHLFGTREASDELLVHFGLFFVTLNTSGFVAFLIQ